MRRSANLTKLVTLVNPKSPISEAYRKLRTNIQFSTLEKQVKVLMIASTQAEEGKTTTICNLAIAYAQEGKRVLLVDADLRAPSLHHIFTQTNRTGLTHLLAGQLDLEEAIVDTGVPGLSLLVSGPIPPNPSELLSSGRMQTLMKQMRENYDLVLLDTPPILAVTDALVVSALCDGVILVVASGVADRELVKRAKASLELVNARIVGAVFNNVNRKDAPITQDYGYGL